MIRCPLTGSENVKILYQQKSVPLFQNKVYPTQHEAIVAPEADVILAQSLDTGFVFSGDFDINLLDYDANYQNEQSNSQFFQQHLESVIEIMDKNNLLEGKVLEIGCGKGFFMDILLERGVDITGIDPTYEGTSPSVIKDYYGEKYAYLDANFIILRHTLEHIPKPLDFIQMIAKANNYKGKIYIEIPTFDWIMNNNAVEDIFYEHCNYFVPDTIKLLFEECQCEYIFNGQYIGIIAELGKVKEKVKKVEDVKPYETTFADKIDIYRQLVNDYDNLAIWGAGAKGSTFLNLIDKDCRKVKCVIDINPKKQNRYIGGTGHIIVPPNEIQNYGVENILVMNTNYLNEIKTIINNKINLITL